MAFEQIDVDLLVMGKRASIVILKERESARKQGTCVFALSVLLVSA